MKITPSLIIIAIAANFSALTAHGETFGIKFLGGRPLNTVTGTAGVVPVSGWNNIDNANFSTGPLNSSDNLSQATLTFQTVSDLNTWQSNITPDGGNGSLFSGYMDVRGGAANTMTISGLTGSFYDVYLYTFSDNNQPADNNALLPNYSINGGPNIYASTQGGGGTFSSFVADPTYATNLTPGQTPLPTTFGNYLLFSGVAPDGTGTITITAGGDTTSFRSPLNGIELVTSAVPEPSTYLLGVIGLAFCVLFRARRQSVI